MSIGVHQSYGPPHSAEQKSDDQLDPTFRIRDVALKIFQRR